MSRSSNILHNNNKPQLFEKIFADKMDESFHCNTDHVSFMILVQCYYFSKMFFY